MCAGQGLPVIKITLEEKMQHQNTTTENAMRIVGSFSLIVLPFMLAIAFALHYTALSDFFVFKFVKPPYSAERLLQTLTSPDGRFRLYTLPHMVGYFGVAIVYSGLLVFGICSF